MFCHKCGMQNQDTARYCKKCGVQLKSQEEIVVKDSHTQKKTIICIVGTVLILFAIIAAILIGIHSKKGKEYETYLASAEKYIEELNYEQAEAFYLKAIKIAPKKLKPYVELAETYIVRGEIEKAQNIIKEAQLKKAKGDEEVQMKLEEIIVLLEAAQNMIDYQWVVEPTIEAEDIYYPLYAGEDLDEASNTFHKQYMSPYAVIDTGDGMSLIDMTGTMMVEPEYKEIYRFYQTYWLVRKEPVYTPEVQMEWEHFMWNERTGLSFGGEVGDPYFGGFHYSDRLNRNGANDYLPIPREAFPIQYMNQRHEMEEPYAIYHEDRLVSDFIYDECGSSAEGLLAVCIDDKWGYVDEEGEIVIPIEYDASWDKYDKVYGDDTFDSYCYAASDGYVTLCKDNKWELRDVTGELVIPAGIFEEILPVYKGKCWVKQAEKWGVIELLAQSEEEESVDMGEFFGSLPREFFFSSGAGAWSTELEIRDDGSFIGYYHDSDGGDVGDGYPNGTRYECGFTGRFTVPEKISEYIYRMEIDYIETDITEGEIYFQDGVKCIGSNPYGMETGGEFYVYLPGAAVDEMVPDFLPWTHGMVYDTDHVMPEGCYGIYNTSGAGFVSSTSFDW